MLGPFVCLFVYNNNNRTHSARFSPLHTRAYTKKKKNKNSTYFSVSHTPPPPPPHTRPSSFASCSQCPSPCRGRVVRTFSPHCINTRAESGSYSHRARQSVDHSSSSRYTRIMHDRNNIRVTRRLGGPYIL